MEMLKIESSARLTYVEPTSEREELFKDIIEMPHLPKNYLEKSPQEQAELWMEYERELKNETSFLLEIIMPKAEKGNQSVIIHSIDCEGNPVGRVVINCCDTNCPSLDVRVLPEKRRNGYGYEMIKAISSAAFKQYGYDHLEYDLFSTNSASRGLILKLGGQLTYKDERGECYRINRPDLEGK